MCREAVSLPLGGALLNLRLLLAWSSEVIGVGKQSLSRALGLVEDGKWD